MLRIKKEKLIAVNHCVQDSCPRWLCASDGAKILESMDFDYDEKLASRFTEVIENFGLQILSAMKQEKRGRAVTVSDLENCVSTIELVG